MSDGSLHSRLEPWLEWCSAHAGVLLLVIAVLLMLLLAMIVVIVALRRPRRPHSESSDTGMQSVRNLEKELSFVFEVIGEFSNLLTRLETQQELRKLPQILVEAMVRIYKAEQAIVMVRRRNTMADPDQGNKLIVAAMATAERGISDGAQLNMGVGHLGMVGQCQRVIDRQDYELSHDTTASDWPIFDVAAPMVVNDRTLGVIAFSRPHRRHARDKEILRMIAQLGAMTWTNIATYRSVKVAADVDELTGIFNKRALRFKLSELIYEARENRGVVSAFMFDIDHFKNYNDKNGHVAGDHLLRALSHLVKETVRSDDVFGRFGGEEFLLILPGRSMTQAMGAAENIRRRIAAYNFPNGEKQPLGKLTVSGGVATFPDDADDAVDLVKAADAALYRAKEEGRNSTCKAETGLNPNWG